MCHGFCFVSVGLNSNTRGYKSWRSKAECIKWSGLQHLCLSERHCKPLCNQVLSTCSRNPKLIFVAVSHLSIWDCYLTDEVMTYYPKKSEKKQYFEIRSDVWCLTSVKDDQLILAVHVRSCFVSYKMTDLFLCIFFISKNVFLCGHDILVIKAVNISCFIIINYWWSSYSRLWQ